MNEVLRSSCINPVHIKPYMTHAIPKSQLLWRLGFIRVCHGFILWQTIISKFVHEPNYARIVQLFTLGRFLPIPGKYTMAWCKCTTEGNMWIANSRRWKHTIGIVLEVFSQLFFIADTNNSQANILTINQNIVQIKIIYQDEYLLWFEYI